MTLRDRILAALTETPQSANRIAGAVCADANAVRSALYKLTLRGLCVRSGTTQRYRYALPSRETEAA